MASRSFEDGRAASEDVRAGRWRGRGKTECGIHFSGAQAVRAENARANKDETV